MAFYGVASNLVNYLTTQLHEDTVSSVRNVNNWSGSVWITPILGACIADSYLGRFWTFTLSSLIYVLVTSFLFLSNIQSTLYFSIFSPSRSNCVNIQHLYIPNKENIVKKLQIIPKLKPCFSSLRIAPNFLSLLNSFVVYICLSSKPLHALTSST